MSALTWHRSFPTLHERSPPCSRTRCVISSLCDVCSRVDIRHWPPLCACHVTARLTVHMVPMQLNNRPTHEMAVVLLGTPGMAIVHDLCVNSSGTAAVS